MQNNISLDQSEQNTSQNNLNDINSIEMGNLLIEGGGKNTKAALFYFVSGIVSIIFFMYLAIISSNWVYFYGKFLTLEVRTLLQIFYYILAASGIGEILGGLSISKSNIKLYENGLTGKGITKWFFIGVIKKYDFKHFSYNQVVIKSKKEQIKINIEGIDYIVYVKNAKDIEQMVCKQKN